MASLQQKGFTFWYATFINQSIQKNILDIAISFARKDCVRATSNLTLTRLRSAGTTCRALKRVHQEFCMLKPNQPTTDGHRIHSSAFRSFTSSQRIQYSAGQRACAIILLEWKGRVWFCLQSCSGCSSYCTS